MSAAFGEKCYPNLSGIDQAGLGHFIASPALHPDSPATLSPARRFLEKSPAIPRLIAIVIWCVETAIPPADLDAAARAAPNSTNKQINK